jgi:anti-anti-sigma regulatory factor
MATHITQINGEDGGRTILRVEGEMMFDDAMLLEKIALGISAELGAEITLDLADLDFLDSESAPIIKRLQDKHGFKIEGMEIFLQASVNDVERREL